MSVGAVTPLGMTAARRARAGRTARTVCNVNRLFATTRCAARCGAYSARFTQRDAEASASWTWVTVGMPLSRPTSGQVGRTMVLT
ncbi:Uncharacterised protein [Mycobacterium tuberculosis]|nr:Uncharacterised protein [Mycobacterium tuberculosis]